MGRLGSALRLPGVSPGTAGGTRPGSNRKAAVGLSEAASSHGFGASGVFYAARKPSCLSTQGAWEPAPNSRRRPLTPSLPKYRPFARRRPRGAPPRGTGGVTPRSPPSPAALPSLAGAVAVAEFIAESPRLLRLDLRENEIKTGGLMALSLALKVNHSLLRLDLDREPKKESVGNAPARPCLSRPSWGGSR